VCDIWPRKCSQVCFLMTYELCKLCMEFFPCLLDIEPFCRVFKKCPWKAAVDQVH
jgi:hypothetical protein